MPQLDVPLIKQPPDTGLCGVACLAMIFGYHSRSVSYDDVQRQVQLVETSDDVPLTGLSMPMLGTYLQQNGFQTTLVTANQKLFCGTDIGASQQKVRDIVIGQHSEAKNSLELVELNRFTDYMDAGGEIDVAIPSQRHIQREIDAKRPLIALGTTRFMAGVRSMNFHFTVVTGYEDQTILVNDPGANRGGKLLHPKDWWFHCLTASTYAGWDNASLLTIRPQIKGKEHDQSLHA